MTKIKNTFLELFLEAAWRSPCVLVFDDFDALCLAEDGVCFKMIMNSNLNHLEIIILP